MPFFELVAFLTQILPTNAASVVFSLNIEIAVNPQYPSEMYVSYVIERPKHGNRYKSACMEGWKDRVLWVNLHYFFKQ